MTGLQKSLESKMSLIHPKKFRTWEMGLFKLPHLETELFQMAVKVTIASGHIHQTLRSKAALPSGQQPKMLINKPWKN